MAAVIVITLAALSQLVDIDKREFTFQIDPSIDSLIADDNETKLQTQQDNFIFGVSDAIVISARLPNPTANGVLDSSYLSLIDDLTTSLKTLPKVKQVTSLSTAPSALQIETPEDEWGITESLDTSTIAQHAQQYPDRLSEIRQYMTQSALFQGQLVGYDFNSSLLIVQFAPLSDEAFDALDIPSQLDQRLAPFQTKLDFALSGTPLIKHATATSVMADLTFSVPTILALMAIILLAAFRSIRGVWMPIATILLALIWTLAGMRVFGIPLNLITTIVPPLVMTVGLAYAMHVLTDYYNTRYESGADTIKAKELLPELMQKVGQPVLLAGLTTAAGFIALTLSPLQAVDQFAWGSVIGIIASVTLALTFLPASLRLFGCPPQRSAGAKVFHRFAEQLTRFNLANRRLILIAGISIIGIALLGATQIKVGSDYINDFPPDHPVRQDFESINQNYAGGNSFSIVIDGYVDDSFIQPQNLNELHKLQEWLELQPEIGSTIAITDHLRLLNASLTGRHLLPDDAITSKQLIVLAGGSSMRGTVDNQFRSTRIIVNSQIDNSREISTLLQRITTRLDQLPKPLTAHLSGNNLLVTKTVDSIASGQLLSITVALLAVFAILALLFTSIKIGFLTLLPNVLPVAVYFGALGWMGIQLSPTTSLIACIVLGIAVDDTIHYLARFNRDARDAASERGGTFLALKGVLRPVTYTTIALVTGFLVLTASELQNQVRFGALAAFTLVIAWIADITFTPALASKLRIVTLWDVLRLDLGKNIQQTIRLFNGLKPRQARIFALLSTVLKPQAGETIIEYGDTSDGSMFVIIDGEFEVWIPDEQASNGRLMLDKIRRGATVGEVGYFTHKRSANVTAVTSGRVLQFSEQNLEKLRSRFPFIAATVFRNLNNIQAERLARATEQQHAQP